MALLGAGQWQLGQAQQGLAAAAESETRRNIANQNLHQQNEQGKAALGGTIGGAAGAIAGTAIGGPAGGYVGATLGSLAGSFASKLF